MTSFFANLWNAPGSTGFIFLLLLFMALVFLARFVAPALLLWFALGRASRALARLVADGEAAPETIAREIMAAPRLSHAWREYAQTLHQQKSQNGSRLRATAFAGHFFSMHALVETPLRAEFYRHLPGILTGVGIIGTFAGLISGLSVFDVNSDTDVVRLSLRNLIQGVGHAFQVSALAITLAMLCTWLEKSLLSLCGRHVARLAEMLDGLFESGVEEEYLARLVMASEVSARQSLEWKKTLTGEVEALLRAQQEAITVWQKEISVSLARAITGALEAPLSRMAEAVERAGLSQGEATAQSLEPLLSGFMKKMDEQWGASGGALEGLLKQSAETMRRVSGDLERAVSGIKGLGQEAVRGAAGELSQAGEGVGRAAEHFGAVGDTLQQTVRSLSEAVARAGSLVENSAADNAKTRDAFSAMLTELRKIIESARREASLTQELVTRMEGAAAALSSAKTDAKKYLEGVNRVLAEAHASFAENIERTLREGNGQFHKEVALAVDYLKGAIEELGDTLENLAGKK
ncbi:MAG: hypothetical protein LBG69_02725 [Zoogloeaceae bacterium]|jgi:methyl-accepting chemotaxis protein|nr:hypothetical protein [Zoogloeaceae bacterium]